MHAFFVYFFFMIFCNDKPLIAQNQMRQQLMRERGSGGWPPTSARIKRLHVALRQADNLRICGGASVELS
jgi:hypothetical protein